MRNKRGFTLIELLAVIVILAIISLIATPIVLNIISDSKTKSYEMSAENYIKTIKNAIIMKNIKENFNPSICNVEYDEVVCDDVRLDVQIDGDKLESGILIYNDNKLLYAEFEKNNNIVYSKGGTDEDCFVSFAEGEINDYICDDKIVALGNNLKLNVKKPSVAKYNHDKCLEQLHNEDTCNEFKANFDENNELVIGEELSGDYATVLTKLSDVIEYKVYSSEKYIVNRIGSNSFVNKNIGIIYLNNNINEIGEFSFAYNNLQYVRIPDSVDKIDRYAFWDNPLKKVEIGSGINTIKYGAFSCETTGIGSQVACIPQLEEVIIHKEQLDNIFENKENTFDWKNNIENIVWN